MSANLGADRVSAQLVMTACVGDAVPVSSPRPYTFTLNDENRPARRPPCTPHPSEAVVLQG
jgi:hypothetical protein